MNFFKTLLASMFGTILAFGLLIFIFIMFIISAVSSSEDKAEKPKENSVLHITLDQAFAERGSDNEFSFNAASFQSEHKTGLNHFIKELERAKNDNDIKGIFLETGGVMGAPSTLLDVRRAIADFKSSGKWVVAYAEDFGQGDYYVASAASEVYMYPQGSMDWRGINSEVMFFKKLLDKLEIEAQIIRGPDNKFKSAVEPFMYDQMSPSNKLQVETFISDIWRVMLDGISEARGVSVEALNLYADSLALVSPEKVVEAHMIDGLKYRDEVMAILKSKLGLDATAKDEDIEMVDLADYRDSGFGKDDDDDDKPDFKKDKVAVVYAVGAIESGEGDDETIGSERIAAALKKAREDEKVKAIVLRVNSPGGSALASDVIWRETMLIKQSGKPFYVSMGDYAASGGYYISCAADKIYANANTITGSIGVFGVVPNMQKFWDNKLGITFDRYETNPHADLMSTNKPLDAAEQKAIHAMVDEIYYDFTSKVAQGRHMQQADVDSIGQGRVWSGEDAKNLGLVDVIGNLNDCIAAVAAQAGIADYSVKELPAMIDPFQQLVEELTGEKQARVMQEVLGDQYKTYENVRDLSRVRGIQARMPFFIEIQ